MTHTFHIGFWLQKIKNSAKRYVSCRVTVNGKSTEVSTGIRVEPQYWDETLKRIDLNRLEKPADKQTARKNNRQLDEVEETLRHIEKELRMKKEKVSPTIIKQLFKGETPVKKEVGFLETFDKWIVQAEAEQETVEGKEKVTIQTYQNRRNNYRVFLEKEYAKKDILLSEMPSDFQERAKFYFQKKHYVIQYQKFGLCPEQVNRHLAVIDIVLEFARKKGCLLFNPTTKERIKTSHYPRKEKVYLDFEELLHLQSHVFTLDELRHIGYGDEVKLPYVLQTTQLVADCFVFGCYTGLAFNEQKNMSAENEIIGFDGKKWLKLIRGKNKRLNPEPVYIPLLEIPRLILDKYRQHPLCHFKNTLLPVPSNAEYNRAIKDIARIMNCTKHLTTHVARKTFTTLFVNSVKNPEMAALILGDTEAVMKTHYLSVQHQTIAQTMQEFEEQMKEKQKALKSG
jgi:integrase/recombinase XerD